MTRDLPSSVQPVAAYLSADHGRYLLNAAFNTGSTCSICSTPVNHVLDAYCPQCRQLTESADSICDRVGILIYAVQYDTQAYRLVQQYKGNFPGPDHILVMRSLLALGLRGHVECDLKLSGFAPREMGWAVVPSSKGRDTLTTLVRRLAARPETQVPLDVTPHGFEKHVFRPANFVVPPGTDVPRHVLLIDDSWVSGANAQSAASALKLAGAHDVSIFAVARVLKPTYEPTKRFLSEFGQRSFDPSICPWTGNVCP
ncbi:ComF family protein [Promicromonospora sp. NPDC060271]|uniref:ComF family protein n=1 Tax=Promicromonospora sp. NPDC060271 TaxID=3347089 RepID=UPI003648ACC4